jgi:hypothetical protein
MARGRHTEMHEVFKFHRLRTMGERPHARPKTNFHARVRGDHLAGLLATCRQVVLSTGVPEVRVAPVMERRIQEGWLDINPLFDNDLEGCFIEIIAMLKCRRLLSRNP